MFRRVRIGIAEDQEIFRRGLIELLSKVPQFDVCQEAENGLALIQKMNENCPDVVIIDYNLPILNGVETVKEIRKRFPQVKTIMLSMYDDEKIVQNAFEIGVNGYLSKDDGFDEIPNAINDLLINQYYMNDRYTGLLLKLINHKKGIAQIVTKNDEKFTIIELQILELISQEKTNKEIAETLKKSVRSIEKHKSTMMDKAGVHNSVGLIMFAIRNRILSF